MNWKEYTDLAIKTATHDSREKYLTCMCFGMLGEWAELEEKVLEGADSLSVKKELGDFCWYLANYAEAFNISNPRKSYVDFLEKPTWMYIADLQEFNKKLYRDKNWEPTEEDIIVITEQVSVLLSIVKEWCRRYNFNLSDILQLNIEKLQDRQKRNKLSGSGDER